MKEKGRKTREINLFALNSNNNTSADVLFQNEINVILLKSKLLEILVKHFFDLLLRRGC